MWTTWKIGISNRWLSCRMTMVSLLFFLIWCCQRKWLVVVSEEKNILRLLFRSRAKKLELNWMCVNAYQCELLQYSIALNKDTHVFVDLISVFFFFRVYVNLYGRSEPMLNVQCVGKRRYIYRWRDIAMHKMNTKYCEWNVWAIVCVNCGCIEQTEYIFSGLRTHNWHSHCGKWFETRIQTRSTRMCETVGLFGAYV